MPALVLKKFTVNDQAKGKEDAVHIIGRQAGIMAFLLSLMKIDPVTELKCNDMRVEVTQSSFFGRLTVNVPIAATTGIVGGYKKPQSLFFSIIAILMFGMSGAIAIAKETGSAIPVLLLLVIVVIMFVVYILKKEMSLFVQNGGDKLWGLTFKGSLIENVQVDINAVNRAIELINEKVLAGRAHPGRMTSEDDPSSQW